MKLKNIFVSSIAILGMMGMMLLTSCNKEETLPASLKANVANLTIGADEGAFASFAIKATRNWTITLSGDAAENLTVTPSEGVGTGEETTITVTAKAANEGRAKFGKLTIKSGSLTPVTIALTNEGKITGPYTVAEIRSLPIGTKLPAGAVMNVTVLNNQELLNFSQKNCFVQDATGGITVRFNSAYDYTKGDNIEINVEEQSTSEYGGVLQISATTSDVKLISSDNEIAAKQVTIADFLENKYEGQYVELSGVQFVEADLEKKFVEYKDPEAENPKYGTTDIRLEDAAGNSIIVYSYCYGDEEETYPLTELDVPDGSGSIKGIATVYTNDSGVSQYELILTDESDIEGMTSDRFESAAQLSIGVASAALPPVNGTYTLNVSSNIEWTASSSAEWLTISPASGTGDAEITLTYSAYESTEPREAVVTLNAEAGKTATFTATQQAAQTLALEEFITLEDNDDVYYRLSGEVVSISSASNGNITISETVTEGEGENAEERTTTLYLYKMRTEKFGENGIEGLGLYPGCKLTVEACKGSYNDNPQGVNAYYISHTEPELTKSTIAEVLAAEHETLVYTEGVVIATNTSGFLIKDASGLIYVHTYSEAAVGDKVSVKGLRAEYNGIAQISDCTFTKTGTGTVETSTPAEWTKTELDAVALNEREEIAPVYMKLTGTLEWSSASKVYVTVDGADKELQFSYYEHSEDCEAYNGQKVTVTGWVTGLDSEKVQILVTDLYVPPFLSTDEDIVVEPSATSATFSVYSNVENWTISTDATWVTLSKTTGSGSAEITAEFAANTEAQPRTATFTVSAEGMESVSFTLTQKLYDPTLVYTLNAAKQSGYTAYAKEYEFTIDGIEWNTFNANLGNWDTHFRFGGKNLTSVDCLLYSGTAISQNIKTVAVYTNGISNANLKVNSVTLTVHSSADDAAAGSNAIATFTNTDSDWAISTPKTLTFTKADVTDWSGKFYRIAFNVTNSKGSNYGIDLTKVEFRTAE